MVYGSFFIAVFNVICWTYGYRMMSGGAKVSLRTVLLNPGIIGLAVGLPLYFLGLQLPAVLAEPVGFFSDLNTPLAMLIIGSYIAKVDLHSFVSDMAVYQMAALRLIVAPALFLPACSSFARARAAGHQRHPGQRPGGGQHGALRRAVWG